MLRCNVDCSCLGSRGFWRGERVFSSASSRRPGEASGWFREILGVSPGIRAAYGVVFDVFALIFGVYGLIFSVYALIFCVYEGIFSVSKGIFGVYGGGFLVFGCAFGLARDGRAEHKRLEQT